MKTVKMPPNQNQKATEAAQNEKKGGPGPPLSEAAEEEVDAPATPSETKSNTSGSNGKCSKCGSRQARGMCTQNSCVKCCDDTACQVHSKAKEQRNWREQVLAKTTDAQVLAAELRRRRLPPGRFREPRFLFSGSSLVLWDLRAFFRNPKWKEDALRKSRRREQSNSNREGDKLMNSSSSATAQNGGRSRTIQGNSKRRFRRIMKELYEKSLEAEATANNIL